MGRRRGRAESGGESVAPIEERVGERVASESATREQEWTGGAFAAWLLQKRETPHTATTNTRKNIWKIMWPVLLCMCELFYIHPRIQFGIHCIRHLLLLFAILTLLWETKRHTTTKTRDPVPVRPSPSPRTSWGTLRGLAPP